MPRLWAKTVTFDSVAPGDQLPILAKGETGETIKQFSKQFSAHATPSEPSFDATGPALVAYVAELLEKGFRITSIQAAGGSLELELHRPVAAGDILVLSGRVVSKQETQGQRLVGCEITVENQDGETVALAHATVCM